eukprot:2840779-Rhodomonas_salina.2
MSVGVLSLSVCLCVRVHLYLCVRVPDAELSMRDLEVVVAQVRLACTCSDLLVPHTPPSVPARSVAAYHFYTRTTRSSRH